MNEIDWSKAPEGATHYNPTRFGWYKVGSHEPSFWDGRVWAPALYWDDRKHNCIQRPTTPSWSGEGLPPVGVVCEVKLQEEWRLCEIIAHFQQPQAIVAAFTVAQFHGGKKLDSKIAECFRPIRTPEQIAADEREAAIDEMLAATPAPGSDISLRVCEKLYDAGYRKP